MHAPLKMLHKLYIKNKIGLSWLLFRSYHWQWYAQLSEEQLRTNLDRTTGTRRDTSLINILTVNDQNAQNSRQEILHSPLRKTPGLFSKAQPFAKILAFSGRKIRFFSFVFLPVNLSIRSIIRKFSGSVNARKTLVLLVLPGPLTHG